MRTSGRVGKVRGIDLLDAQLDRQGRAEFRHDPIADGEFARLLIGAPCLDPLGLWSIGQGGNQQRRLQTERQ